MKRSGKRLLALLLSLTMVLSLLPAAALPVFAATDVGVQGWVARDSSATGCVTEEGGKIKLSATTSVANFNVEGSAVIINDEISAVLNAQTGEKFFEAVFEPHCDANEDGKLPAFGLAINAESKDKAYYVGFDSGANWYSEYYGGTNVPGDAWPSWDENNRPDAVVSGTKYKIRVTWNNEGTGTASVKVWVGDEIDGADSEGTEYTLPNSGNLCGITGPGKIALKTSNYNGATGTYVLVSDIDYSGKGEISTYSVSGTVSAADGGVSGAAVSLTADGFTSSATTEEDGSYSIGNVFKGTYTLTVTKDGYETATRTVTVNNADVTENVTLTLKDSYKLPTDGVNDTWKQVEDTKVTGSVDPVVENGKLKLTAVAGNLNNCDGTPPPAFFINEQLNAAVAAAGTGERTLSFDITPDSTTDNICLGFGLNFTDRSHEVFIGYNTIGSWFVQYYGGTGAYPSFTGPALAKGTTYHIEIKWTDEKITLFKVDDTECSLPNSGGFGSVAVADAVGFKCGKDPQSSGITSVEISNFHYTGQTEVDAYAVRGTVKVGETALAGATVTATGTGTTTYSKTTTTDATGAYQLILPAGTYDLTATKTDHSVASESIEVTNAAVTQDFTLTTLPTVTGKVVDSTGAGIAGATVALTTGSGTAAKTRTVATGADGTYTITGVAAGTYTITVTAVGYETATKEDVEVVAADVTVDDIVLTESTAGMLKLEGTGMDVLVDADFPRVIQYRLKDGRTMDGQKEEIDTININGTKATLGTITSVLSADKQTVTYTIPMAAPVEATMTVRLTLDNEVNKEDSTSKDRTLGFYIDKVEYAGDDDAAKAAARLTNPVKSIEIPNHSLVSVNSTQAGAAVTGAKTGNNSVTTNDVTYQAANNKTYNGALRYFAAFVSNNSLAAGMSTNSSLNGGTPDNRADYHQVVFKSDGENVTISLQSTAWPYDYLLADSNPGNGQGYLDHTADLTPEQKVINPELREQPYVKVVIAPDLNGDATVDWQDAAIALRETVMHIPNNSSTVKDRVNTRIALNFGSQAQNPFLTSLDNAKRVALHTDGLGQAILLKGYANEGHDSGHPDYWDMGTRMGGAEDFKTMLKDGKEIGAYFGIHVNAGELYAEAKALDFEHDQNKLVYFRADGRVKWGWHWHDTAISFKTLYDYGTGKRAERFQRLAELGGADLEFIYVDIWGNSTGGTDDSWQTRQLSNEITQHVNNGKWRIAHEWSYGNPVDSTFQHWTTDYTYGGHGDKGQLNSAVIRFLLNEYKDSFPPDFATFGGACNAPLLGGPAMQGFEGWQADGEYDLSIYNTFNQMVPTKFLQHYSITSWTNAETTVKMPYATGANNARSQSADWAPELQIKLASGDDTVVVTRGTTGALMTDATLAGMNTTAKFLENETEYRSRTITLNGKTILKGAPASAGEDTAFPAEKATLEYLIPWYWTTDGVRVSPANEKLYYWNGNANATSSSEWDLPSGWTTLETVTLYELSDQGRGTPVTVSVTAGKVTFTGIKPNTPYVVVKGEDGAAAPAVTYTAKGMHLTDPSFNDASLSAWTKTGGDNVAKINSIKGISVLKMEGTGSVSQTLTEMTAGKKYAVYVAVENRSDDKAIIEIKSGDTVLASNYTVRSMARNYISGDSLNNKHGVEAGGSYMQNMYVFFTMPDTGDVTLTLRRDGNGEGNVYFDAVRVVETQMDGYTYDEDTGKVNGLRQDFEHSAQGEWPFVVGPVEGVQDNRQHLSEKNVPFTQSGWNIKEVDDVIEGNWSLKTHGIAGGSSLVYQTIPQNFRFEPGKTYVVSFDYEMGYENLMQVVIGDGAWTNVSNCQTVALEVAKGAAFEGYPAGTMTITKNGNSKTISYDAIPAGTGKKTCTFTVVGSESGESWFGIATAGGNIQFYDSTLEDWFDHNEGIPDRDGYALYYSGRGDFILDNLTITVGKADKAELNALAIEANEMVEYDYNEKETGAWDAFVAARTAANAVLDNIEATQGQVDNARDDLEDAMAKLEKVVVVLSGTVKEGDKPVAGAVVILENDGYYPIGLTATTNAAGEFEFRSTEEVNLTVTAYKLKVEAAGYLVDTVDAAAITKAQPTSSTAITVEPEAPGAYVNDFNNGDVSMIGTFATSDDKPTWEAVDCNGGKALKITFNSTAGETRGINNVMDMTEAAKIANGTVSFDITGLTNGKRLGLTMRATSMNTRIFVGQHDSYGNWFWEWWKEGGSPSNSWSSTITDKIAIEPGVTRRVRIELNGENVKVFIDGVEIVDADMTDAPTEAGFVGINMRDYAGTSYILDNLRIVSADAPKAGTYTVEGAVKEGTSPLPGASVEVYKTVESVETLVTSTTSNANGLYKTQAIATGTYTVKLSAPGYEPKQETLVIGTENITGKDFTLTASKTELETLYNAHKDDTQGSYTTASWTVFETARAAAATVKDKDGATKAEIDKAIADLTAAVEGLVEPGDKTALDAAITAAGDEDEDDYTPRTWAVLAEKLEAAEAVKADENASQEEIDAATAALTAAIEALKARADKTALNAAITAAEDEDEDDYTPGTWAVFAEKLAAAKAVAGNANATQAQVDEAKAALDAAKEALVERADKAALQALITEVEALTATDYTTTSWTELQTKLGEAKTVNGNDDATQAQVDAAKEALAAAKAALVDTTELQALITEVEALTAKDYTTTSWNALQAKLSEAKDVLASGDATQAQVDAAKEALAAAKDALAPRTDMTALQAAYDEASALNPADYTSESWAAVAAALETAEAVLANGDATEAQVNAATEALNTAKGALVRTYGATVTVTNGSATHDGPVASGATLTVTITPDSGYDKPTEIASVTMGGTELVVDEGYTYDAETGVITIQNVTGSVTITAVCPMIQTPTLDAPVSAIPPTTSETKTNEDGTTTTTVIDNLTGTKTETTEKADGTVEVVETKKDGTVTATTENPDGSSEVVETKPDGTVTETNTDPEGGKVEKVTTPEKDVTITVTDAEGEVLAKVELPGEIPEPETRFVDVPEGHWADEAIHNMAALEVVKGVGDDRYNMNGGMTRGALATVLSRMSNGQEGLESSFADVDADKWYADGIAWAAKTGVVTGYSATEFGPDDTITREQLAVMLCRYARLLGMDTTADSAELDSFNDGSSTHDWAADSIAWCVANGILKGKGNATLAPTATATRAEVAVMLQRFVDMVGGK